MQFGNMQGPEIPDFSTPVPPGKQTLTIVGWTHKPSKAGDSLNISFLLQSKDGAQANLRLNLKEEWFNASFLDRLKSGDLDPKEKKRAEIALSTVRHLNSYVGAGTTLFFDPAKLVGVSVLVGVVQRYYDKAADREYVLRADGKVYCEGQAVSADLFDAESAYADIRSVYNAPSQTLAAAAE